jgi:hypothetical protein
MKNWLVLAIATLILIAALCGPKRSFDSAPPAVFDPLRSVRVAVMRPFYEAASALDMTADW